MPNQTLDYAAPETPLLAVEGLHIKDSRGRVLVDNVSIDVCAGEAVSIVGESGSGKSLTAKAIIGLLPRGLEHEGSIKFQGREVLDLSDGRRAALRGSKICMIMQDPFTMLHPMLKCGDIITENLRDARGRKLGAQTRRVEARTRLAEVGISDERVIDQFPSQLSGGMRQRVGIAAALAQDPELLIADEPSTALDASTQFEVLQLLRDLQQTRGMALILITHDLSVAFSVSKKMSVLYAGSIMERGPSDIIRREPLHPYSLGLLMAEPPLHRRVKNLVGIPGSVPDADTVLEECAFAARCRWSTLACHQRKPNLVEAVPDHWSSCIRQQEISSEMLALKIVAEQDDLPLERMERKEFLRAENIEVTFRGSSRKENVHAVRGVSIQIGEGESVGIVGESGSGKTTLSRSIVGLNSATAGSISIDGIEVAGNRRLTKADRIRLRQTVQMVFQDPYSSLNPVLSIRDTLLEASAMRNAGKLAKNEVGSLLERVGLPVEYGERMPAELSGGERQRVAIARAIATRPKLLICDEPVSALDVSVQAQILTLLRDLRSELGLAYLFITHDLAVVRQISDRLYVMRNGEVVEEGETYDILDRPDHAYTKMLVSTRA